MVPSYLTKPLADDRLFDVDCQDLLDDDELILSAANPGAFNGLLGKFSDENGLVYGPPLVNLAPIAYPRLGRVAGIGKAFQVRISGGQIPDGVPGVTVRLQWVLVTTANPALVAPVQLRIVP